MAKGRKPNTVVVPAQVGPTFVGATPPDMAAQELRVSTMLAEISDNAKALATELGYEGALSVGALEDEIRFYQRRSVEACLELGKRLLILKELTPHSEFVQRLELLNVDHTMAKRFMTATLKFSKGASTHLLTAAGTQTKMLELLTLDDDEIEDLEAGKTVRGITLDKLTRMSVRELRTAVREGAAVNEATARLLSEARKRNDDLTEKYALIKTRKPDGILAELRSDLASFAISCEAELSGRLMPAVEAILDHHREHGGDSHEVLEGTLRQIERMTASLRAECGLPGGPTWNATE